MVNPTSNRSQENAATKVIIIFPNTSTSYLHALNSATDSLLKVFNICRYQRLGDEITSAKSARQNITLRSQVKTMFGFSTCSPGACR